MKHDPEIITTAIDLWVKNLSLRQIKDHLLNHHGIAVSHVTVLGWVQKYGNIINEFTDTLRPNLEGDWTADELVHFFAKNHNWLWTVMHKDKKFIIAFLMSQFREQQNADSLFEEAASRTNVPPRMIQTDGLLNYPQAIRRTLGKYGTKHERHGMKSKVNMNVMERLQGTQRDRLKTTRGFYSVKTGKKAWILWVNDYNYLRPHTTLGTTPAQACGIDLGLKGNKLRDLIEKSMGGGL